MSIDVQSHKCCFCLLKGGWWGASVRRARRCCWFHYVATCHTLPYSHKTAPPPPILCLFIFSQWLWRSLKTETECKHGETTSNKNFFNALSFCIALFDSIYKSQPTCCELSLHLLENWILGCGLGPAGQWLRCSAGEHVGNIGNVLQADSKGANELLDKVECVGCDLGIRHCTALFKGHWVTFRQALLKLP